MTRSYTEDEWMGVEPVRSRAIRDESDTFDWDAWEREERASISLEWKQRALEEVEYYRTHTLHHIYCSCGRIADAVYLPNDTVNVAETLAKTPAQRTCWLHERG